MPEEVALPPEPGASGPEPAGPAAARRAAPETVAVGSAQASADRPAARRLPGRLAAPVRRPGPAAQPGPALGSAWSGPVGGGLAARAPAAEPGRPELLPTSPVSAGPAGGRPPAGPGQPARLPSGPAARRPAV